MGVLLTICVDWPQTVILSISASYRREPPPWGYNVSFKEEEAKASHRPPENTARDGQDIETALGG
jgi:hypothetical protein